jgi:hypothetical protein
VDFPPLLRIIAPCRGVVQAGIKFGKAQLALFAAPPPLNRSIEESAGGQDLFVGIDRFTKPFEPA